MPSTDPRIDAYIAGAAAFAQPILTHLRSRVHAACPTVDETIKWGMPFFLLGGRPFANMAAFKAHASFGFWKGRDAAPEGAAREGMGLHGRIASVGDLPDDATLEAHIREAAARLGTAQPARAARVAKRELEVPTELADALAGDALAATTFRDFSPSCRRDYVEWIAEAKRETTRAKRVAETMAWLREGKRRNWKYEG